MSESFLIKSQTLRNATLLKVTPAQVFCCEIYEIVKNIFSTENLQWLLLPVSGFQPVTLLKMRLQQRCVSVNFAEFLGTSFDRAPVDECFLCLSVNFEKFFGTPLL